MVSTLAAELGGRAPADPAEPRSRLLPFRSAGGRIGGWLSAAAAVAAVLFLLVRSPAALPPLTAYTATLHPGAQSSRGGSDPAAGRQIFVPGSPLIIDAEPQQSVTGPVEADFFLEREAELVPWNPAPPFEISNGSVRLRGTVGEDLRLEPGDWRVWVVVGRPGKMPSLEELRTALRAGRTGNAGWRAVSADLRIASRASP
jgi:hypothetical protein